MLGIVGRDGAHAEFLRLPSRNLIEVPDNVSNEQAVFAEPLAAAYGITEQVDIEPETRVAVIGDGKLGLLCAMSLALRVQKCHVDRQTFVERWRSPARVVSMPLLSEGSNAVDVPGVRRGRRGKRIRVGLCDRT